MAKNKTFILAMAVSLCILASCSQPSVSGTGSMRIDIPAKYLSSSASKDAGAARSVADTYRIYLEVSGSLVPLVSGTSSSYYEGSTPSDGSVTISDVNPVVNANLYFCIGTKNSDGTFVVSRYAVSSSKVTITAAATTAVSLTSYASPFTRLDCSADSSGIKATAVGGTVYAVDGGKLYSYASGTWTKSDSLADLSSLTVNGLEAGKVYSSSSKLGGNAVWINTSSGIRSYDSGSGLGASAIAGTSGKTVLDSGAFSLTYGGTSYDIAYYQQNGILGFGYTSNGSWTWTTTSDIKQVASLLANSSSIIITDKDINSDSGYGYFVTSVTGALGMTVSDMTTKFGSVSSDLSVSQVQSLMSDSMVTLPKYLSVQPVVSSIARGGSYLYVGSNRNLFATKLEDGAVVNNSGFVALLGSITSITKVRACVYGGTSYAAVLTSDGDIVICKDGALYKTYKFYMGLPSLGTDPASTADIFWVDQGLVVSGIDGLAVLPFAQL